MVNRAIASNPRRSELIVITPVTNSQEFLPGYANARFDPELALAAATKTKD